MLNDPIIFCLIIIILVFVTPILLASEVYTIKTVIYIFSFMLIVIVYRDEQLKAELELEHFVVDTTISKPDW